MDTRPEKSENRALPVIDFHSHILPGVDDGSASCAATLELLRCSAREGVDVVAATPHFHGARQELGRFMARRQRAWESVRALWTPELPRVLAGAETALFPGLEELDGLERLCIGRSSVLLLEMPPARWTGYEADLLVHLILDRKLQVVLAHVERYAGIPQDPALLERIGALGPYLQVNGGTLLSWRRRGPWVRAFGEGRVHLLGSDCHNLTSRRPNLGQARALLARKGGPRLLRRIDRIGGRLLGL